jgi:hypothetical protein
MSENKVSIINISLADIPDDAEAGLAPNIIRPDNREFIDADAFFRKSQSLYEQQESDFEEFIKALRQSAVIQNPDL